MDSERLGIWARLWLAIILPWKILFDGALAARTLTASRTDAALPPPREPEKLPPPEPRPEPPAEVLPERLPVAPPPALVAQEPVAPPKPAAPDETTALQLLAILQREGRFLDFLQENVTSFSDAEVGAAARVVHEGCKRGLKDYLVIEPVRAESEGAPVVLDKGFDPARNRVTGNVVGEPPFKGKLVHHGWQVKELRLPALTAGHDPRVLAPAEVEL